MAAVALTVFGAGPTACSEPRETDRAERPTPLQPLVYTEDPDHSPRAAAVRERRLMRQLLEGAGAEGESWGTMESDSSGAASSPTSPEELGRALYRALVEHEDAAWDVAFVSPGHYASLVQVPLEKARKFVDGKQADARGARMSFAIENPSEAPQKGLASIFSFEGLELGDGRTLDGDLADDDETVTQYWDNRLKLSLKDDDVLFELKIPKILRIPTRGKDGNSEGKSARLGVASTLRIGSRLRVFLETGMHLKPELLRSFEYPIPLAVGNYWRYTRTVPDDARQAEDPPTGGETADEKNDRNSDSEPEEKQTKVGMLEASRVTLKVHSVDRFGTRRLVEMRWLYNDAELTQSTEHWLVTPRRVFTCPRPCRRQVDDLSWLLAYLRRQTPIFRFPLGRGESWGGRSAGGEPAFSIRKDWKNLELPAGSFFGVFEVRGTGPLEHRVPFHRIRSLRRLVAPGTGVVRRRYRTPSGSPTTVVELLSDYRLMSR